MNRLERDWLTRFVTDYQSILLKIEQRKAYLEEVQDEIVRVHSELRSLAVQKEKILVNFAELFLRNADKAKQRAETSHF